LTISGAVVIKTKNICMKIINLIGFLFISISNFLYSQESITYQPDSVYKINKVKLRREYEIGEEAKKILASTNYYDLLGKLYKYELEPLVDGQQISTYYNYDMKGKIVSMMDSIIYGEPNYEAMKKLKNIGLDVNVEKHKTNFAVSKYIIEYKNAELITITKYKPDNSIDIIDKFENNEKKQIRYWFRNGIIYRNDTTEFEHPFYYIKYYGCDRENIYDKRCWNYFFINEYDQKGLLSKRQKFENNKLIEEITYFYNDKKLLVQQQNKDIIHPQYPINKYFEYEYY
jgi:hypothetical protein